jgi:hypothetical protein
MPIEQHHGTVGSVPRTLQRKVYDDHGAQSLQTTQLGGLQVYTQAMLTTPDQHLARPFPQPEFAEAFHAVNCR